MAKRVRSRSAHRPGGQGPSRSKKTNDDTTSSTDAASGSGQADIDGAVETVSGEYTEISLEEAPAAAATATGSTRRRRTRRSARAQAESLEGRSAAENVWVRADLRRIGIISVILLVSLAIAYIVFVVMDVLNLY